ncbi:MAG: TM0106 family RecB-like putative nuclease [Candidatus Limnocylindria bacterium]
MQLIDGAPVYSATDLVGFLACEHLTALERAALAELVPKPDRLDPELEIIRKRGLEHEARYLADRKAEGLSVVTIDRQDDADKGDAVRAAAAATERAMREGAQVIYQAAFFDGQWLGYADFLLRVDSRDRPSTFGPYHYQPVDTKLARHVKAGAVIQLCTYVDLLTAVQGVQPALMHVALGGSTHAVEPLRVSDFTAYFRAAKARFMAAVGEGAPAPAYPPPLTYPDPVEHCDVCRWKVDCEARRQTDDHLSLVAGISGRQRKALATRGISTLEALGELGLPLHPPLEGTSAAALQRVREQARIQLEGRREERMKYELFTPEPGGAIDPERGLATLPEPSEGDLFFDIEGDPYAFEDGLDYLFGIGDRNGTFTAIWSTDDDAQFSLDGERRAFERLIGLIMERLERYPGMHVYHYAHYEPAALKRLMGRHATREDEVDRLLRGGVLVDLYRAVTQGLRASVEGYSIKKLEALYGFSRQIDLRDAGSSIVAFEQWLELGDSERPGADHLARIEAYNRDDVESDRRLREWLEQRRDELARISGLPVQRPADRVSEPQPDQAEAQQLVAELAERLTAGVPDDPAGRTAVQHGRWLLAQLLSWHRREDKSTWWEFFRLMSLDPDQLTAESDPIGGLELIGAIGEPAGKRATKQVWHYRYPEQEHDIRVGMDVYDPALAHANPSAKPGQWQAGTVESVDLAAMTIDLKRPLDSAEPHPRSLVPLTVYRTPEQQAALMRIGAWVADHGLGDPDRRYRAGRDVLLRRAPRVGVEPGVPLRHAGEDAVAAARRLALELDRGLLAIQGPPGSGKTYTGARMIVELLAAGRRVGICATSHKVIAHLLGEAIRAAIDERVDVRPMQKADGDDLCDHPSVRQATDNSEVADALANREVNLVGGTAWLWSREQMAEAVDMLFVDEAAQISLANVIAISHAARSLVLLGDPQQLEQPLRGSHPPGAERSALAHYLGPTATMPPDRGLFLETTWRLHPDLCRFTSEAFYDDRLQPEVHLAGQELQSGAPLGGTGLRLVEVPHTGNANESVEEAGRIEELVRALIGESATWIDGDGQLALVTWPEVLIVAPYNAQVGALRRLLPDARIGTVDKFQGQQAPISIYSMATSSPENAPRGMDFLYSLNRLNVATSRARCVTLVVVSPELLRVRARTVKQMRLANALCRYVELAARVSP